MLCSVTWRTESICRTIVTTISRSSTPVQAEPTPRPTSPPWWFATTIVSSEIAKPAQMTSLAVRRRTANRQQSGDGEQRELGIVDPFAGEKCGQQVRNDQQDQEQAVPAMDRQAVPRGRAGRLRRILPTTGITAGPVAGRRGLLVTAPASPAARW